MGAGLDGVADGDEGGQQGGELPSPHQLDAEMHEAQAAADQLEAAEQQAQGTGCTHVCSGLAAHIYIASSWQATL